MILLPSFFNLATSQDRLNGVTQGSAIYRYQLKGLRREIKIGNYPARTLQNLLSEYAIFADQVKQDIVPLRER